MVLMLSVWAASPVNSGADSHVLYSQRCNTEAPAKLDVPHPGPADCFVSVRVGTKRYAMGFAKKWVSVDFDGNGAIEPTERVKLKRELVSFPYTISYGGQTITSSMWVSKDAGTVSLTVNFSRTLKLPDGTVAKLVSENGVFDDPRAYLAVDRGGDGRPDMDFLSRFRVSEGIVVSGEQRWSFAPSVDGTSLHFEETDALPSGLHAGSPAPDFSLVASDGETYNLERFRGKPVVLDFWATWCGPCVALHPEVIEVTTAHEVAVFGISADTDQETLNAWLAEHPTPWASSAVGPKGDVNRDYGVNGWPAHALIDAEGRLLAMGYWHDIRKVIEAL